MVRISVKDFSNLLEGKVLQKYFFGLKVSNYFRELHVDIVRTNTAWACSTQLLLQSLSLCLILRGGYLVKRRGLRDLAVFILMVGASLSFGASKALELIFGYAEPVLVEAARFGSVALLIAIYYFVYC